MGWILLRMALLFALHIMVASADQEQNKDATANHSLESFLRNILDSSQELSKIRNEIKDHEELDDTMRHHPANGGYHQPRQRRKATMTPENKLANGKDPHTLRRVLNLYMKRAQMFRHGKGQNLIQDSQQKLHDSERGKREFKGMYVILPTGKNLQDFGNIGKCYKQNCERKKIRTRRWRCRSGNCEKNRAPNSNNEKSSLIVENKMDNVNKAATPHIQTIYPLLNIIPKGTSGVSNIAPHQVNAPKDKSMVSIRSVNTDSSANLLSSVVPGSRYDLDCVHEMPSLEESLYSREFRGSSSLTDRSSNANEPKPANDIAMDGQNTHTDSKSILGSYTEHHNVPQLFNDMANTKEKAPEPSAGTSSTSNDNMPKDAMEIVNPIVIEVLGKINQAINETSNVNGDMDGVKRLANIKNAANSKKHYQNQAKASAADFPRQQSRGSKTQNSYKKKIVTPSSLTHKSNENELVKKQPLKTNTIQMHGENDLKNKPYTRSKTFQMPHKNYLTKSYSPESKHELEELSTDNLHNALDTARISTSLSTSNRDFSSKSERKQSVPISNTKEKIKQIQESKLPRITEHKTLDHINKPISKPDLSLSNSVQKVSLPSESRKMPLYSENDASLPKGKLHSEIALKTEILHSSNKDKVSNIESKTQNKAKLSEMSLKQKPKNIKQKRNTIEETAGIQQETEDAKLRDDINKRNAREIHGNTTKQSNNSSPSKVIIGENKNITSSGGGSSLTSDNRDQMDAEEAGQSEDTENDQQLSNMNKRSVEPNEGDQKEELLMSEQSNNLVQENELSASDQSKFSESIRRKRYALRFRNNLRKRKRQNQKEKDNKLNSSGLKAHKENNVSQNKNMAKHTDSENKEDSVNQDMLKQVEDMILALKAENHKANDHSKYGSEYSRRIGRRLHSVIDDTKDNSDGSNDNDDYYYYDEDDVDKRRPEHTKVSHNLYRKEILDKLDTANLRKKEMYVQKPFGVTEYLRNENPTNLGSSNNNDPSLNHIQSEQVFSDLITNELNKISLFNKEMPKEVIEARYSRSVTQNERRKDYEGSIMENNNSQSSLSLETDESNKNSRTDKSNAKSTLRERMTADENQQITRLNEGQLGQVNKALNEIVLNQTATSWDEIDQDAVGYNAHMRYKRAGNVHKMDPYLKSDGELNAKKEHIVDRTLKKNSLERSKNLGDSKSSTNANVSKKFELETENHNSTSQINTFSMKDTFSGTANISNILHDTVSKHKEVGNNKNNNGENNKGSITKSVAQTPLSPKQREGNIINSVNSGEFNVSEHNNVTRKVEDTQQHLQSFGSSSDVNSGNSYNDGMLPKDKIHSGTIHPQHEDGNKLSSDLQEFNFPRSSYDMEKVSLKENKNDEIEEKMINKDIRRNELTSELNKKSKDLLEITDTKAKDNIAPYESVNTEKQHLADISQENIQSPDSKIKDKETSPESYNVLLRSKRNGEDYNDPILEGQPEYSDYPSGNETDGYKHDNSTTDDKIILKIVLHTTESPNGLTVSGNTNTALGDSQNNTTADITNNSMYVNSPMTTMGVKEAGKSLSSPPKPDQGDSYSQNVEKKPAEYQSFNVPRYNDNSQLNITINGALASNLVDLVFEAVNASDILKLHLGSALKKTDYGSQEKQPTYDTGFSKEMLEQEEEQYHKKTGTLLSKVMELLDVLVEEEVSKRSCISLQPELQDFLLWMLELPKPGKLLPSDFGTPYNFLFMKQNKHQHDITQENGRQVKDLKQITHQIELLRNLITEYLKLPESEKAKVNYVHSFLTEQLEALQRIHHSEVVRLHSKVDNSSESRLQDINRYGADLNNAKLTQSKQMYRKQNNLPYEAPFKDSKRVTSPKEDSNYSKLTLKHEKSSFELPSSKYISHDSKDHGISNNNPFKSNLKQHPTNNWLKGKRFIKDMASGLKDDISKSHHHRSIIRSHQRKRRFGVHGHGGSRNKHQNITSLHFSTMRYRKLLKRAAEFRERRSNLM